MAREPYIIVSAVPDDPRKPGFVDVTLRMPAALFYDLQGALKAKTVRLAAVKSALAETATSMVTP